MHEEEKVGVALLWWSVGWLWLFKCRCGILNWTGPDILGSISRQFASLHRGPGETHKHRYTQVLNKRVSDGGRERKEETQTHQTGYQTALDRMETYMCRGSRF